MKRKGLIQIYTGKGKGKTTAAIGLACRARGHNLKVCYIYFHKNSKKSGEQRMLKKLGIETFGFAKKHPFFYKNVNKSKVRQECLDALEFIKKIYQRNKYDILILDEIFISLRDGFLTEKELLEILNLKPKNLELVLTGRGATKRVIEKAALVSEIKKLKHPYDLGIQGRKGIEY